MEVIELIDKINKDEILTESYLSNIDVDEYLDSRDNSVEFEQKLLEAFKGVENIGNDEINNYDELSKLIFQKLTRVLGVSELSCYVSEDFEVILKNMQNKTSNEFLETMFNAYKAGQLPSA